MWQEVVANIVVEILTAMEMAQEFLEAEK